MAGWQEGELPETHYAWAGDVSIAYQIMGDGPIDIILTPGIISHVEFFHEVPGYTDLLRRLSRFARVVTFDKRGQGLSDTMTGVPSLDERLEDMLAVLEAAEMNGPVVVIGASEGGSMSALFAATYPQRTQALILYGTMARFTNTPDYPHMNDEEEYLRSVKHWGTGMSIKGFVSSQRNNQELIALWSKGEKLCTSPAGYKRLLQTAGRIDIRPILPDIKVPTLILHRSDDILITVANGHYLAEHIPGAQIVELSGEDHIIFGGDRAPLVAAVEEFLTGSSHEVIDYDSVLATVLFTDIVGSSEKQAALGDRAWRELLDRHDAISAEEIKLFRGKLIKQTGDGLLATFDGPARAVQCARAIRDRLKIHDLKIRAGLHTGEIELRGDDISGIAVNIAARVQDLAEADDVLVTRTITDLTAGSNLAFRAHCEETLKGIPGSWQIHALEN